MRVFVCIYEPRRCKKNTGALFENALPLMLQRKGCMFCSKAQISRLLISAECSNHLDQDANHTLFTDFDHLFTAVRVRLRKKKKKKKLKQV